MPIYLFRCYACGKTAEDYHSITAKDSDVPCECGEMMGRDFQAEQVGFIKDWEPGHNVGIDENYTSKQDLMNKIYRKGLYPKLHGGGVVRANKGLYGDEEFKDVLSYSEPDHSDVDSVGETPQLEE